MILKARTDEACFIPVDNIENSLPSLHLQGFTAEYRWDKPSAGTRELTLTLSDITSLTPGAKSIMFPAGLAEATIAGIDVRSGRTESNLFSLRK